VIVATTPREFVGDTRGWCDWGPGNNGGCPGMSLRQVSAEFEARGFLNEKGHPFAAASVQAMLSE
jgi:hypothetical protein